MKTPRIALAFSLAALAAPSLGLAEINWEKEVWPFIERSCVECHKAPYEEGGKIKEPKAELRFDAAWGILAGGENGPVLVPGKSGDSEMYFRVTLPEDDSDFMPSKGEVLTEKEKEILKKWIDEGGDFGGWEGSLEGKPDKEKADPKDREVKPLPPSVYEKIGANVKAPADAAIKAVETSGARVTPLAEQITLFRVDYFNSRDETGDEDVVALAKMKPNIAQLSLGETNITDKALETVGALPNLVRLDLHLTEIGDKGIAQLAKLKNLQYLNLYGTQVSDAGLKQIGKMKGLKAIYLWRSKVSDKGVGALRRELPKTLVNWR